MIVSSRTPEGQPFHCPMCARAVRLEASWPAGDATCPCCGTLLWPMVRQPHRWKLHALALLVVAVGMLFLVAFVFGTVLLAIMLDVRSAAFVAFVVFLVLGWLLLVRTLPLPTVYYYLGYCLGRSIRAWRGGRR
jgi:uncharacterized paraquat-inducible protein A